MGIAVGVCIQCGGPVGRHGRDLCSWCLRPVRYEETKSACSGCGLSRVLDAGSGKCHRCTHRCQTCDKPLRFKHSTRCKECRRKTAAAAAKRPCPRCKRPGLIRQATGWCGTCSRPPMPRKPPRHCIECGNLGSHEGLGLCSACYQRHPDRPFIRLNGLIGSLAAPPPWLTDFGSHLAELHCPARATTLISSLGKLLRDGGSIHPQTLLERARRPGRSMGTLARALEDFFVARGLALATDQQLRLAAGRRQRRIDAVPSPLRPAVAKFADHLLRLRERSRRAGTRPRADITIESRLSIARDLSRFLVAQQHKTDWSTIDIADIEAFLADQPAQRKWRLAAVRQFFTFARTKRIVLVDPTKGLTARDPYGFRGKTVDLPRQRQLFRRWTTDNDVHPHEALFGLLALLHGVSSTEVRLLRIGDIHSNRRTVQLGQRPHPVILDPPTWTALQRCLAHRDTQRTGNPHVIVTRGTKARLIPASSAYLSHVLDPAGVAPRFLRSTRLLDLVSSLDPKLVAAVFGMTPEAVLPYLTDAVDPSRPPN